MVIGMRRFAATVPVLMVALLALAPTAPTQAAPKMPRVGMLCSPTCTNTSIDAMFDELRKLGWVEGTNLMVERQQAVTRLDQLAGLAADLVRSRPDVIVAIGPQPARAARDATSEIPIVTLFVAD